MKDSWLGNRQLQMAMRLVISLCTGVGSLVCLTPVSFAADAGDSSKQLLTTNSPFVLYMENPPWIKKMLLVQSVFTESGPGPGQETMKGWVKYTNRVAVQPSGMYFESLNPNPTPFTEAASPTQRVVLAVCSRYIWQADVDSHSFSYSFKSPQLGGSESNLQAMVVKIRMEYSINPARYFGLPPLLPGSFRLTDYNHFTATTTKGDPLKGKIQNAVGNRPTRLSYFLGGNTKDSVLLQYRYMLNGELPSYIVRQEPNNRWKYRRNLTNWILSASYGIDLHIQHGYTPDMFFPDLAIFNHFIVSSNGLRYDWTRQGLKPVVERYISPAEALGLQHGRAVPIVILLIFLSGSGVFVWQIARRLRNKNQNQ